MKSRAQDMWLNQDLMRGLADSSAMCFHHTTLIMEIGTIFKNKTEEFKKQVTSAFGLSHI